MFFNFPRQIYIPGGGSISGLGLRSHNPTFVVFETVPFQCRFNLRSQVASSILELDLKTSITIVRPAWCLPL
jgi:hypothetical protein